MKVKCNEIGCKWTGTQDNFSNHHKECKFKGNNKLLKSLDTQNKTITAKGDNLKRNKPEIGGEKDNEFEKEIKRIFTQSSDSKLD